MSLITLHIWAQTWTHSSSWQDGSEANKNYLFIYNKFLAASRAHLLRPSSPSAFLSPPLPFSLPQESQSTRSAMAQDDSVVSAQWLHQHLGAPDVKVLDASWYMPVENRDPWEEYQVAHIPGALFFDIDGIVDQTTDLPHMLPSEEAFAAAVSALDIKNQDKVIVYDGKGFFSAPRVWWMFRVFGHNKVWVLDGGLPQWRASGFDLGSANPDDAVVKSKTANKAVERVYNGELTNTITFKTEFQPHLYWTLEKVAHNVAAKNYQQVDARSKGRFDGVAPEPREGVRSGHIPGSRCVPFPEMFDGAPRLLSADELRKKFQQAGISLDHPIVVSCGSGVTACILALGLYRIGKHDVPVYDGSWTEWEAQSDSDYPKATATAA
ncbi:thiosulfate/3-mercaptopyruvate sulfurtransferase 2-like isoform X2 [Panicum virgatum]|uniref:thiosulfate/3-mercaptopyruvate sulfurtransferase 2-like isoform X2 n=1 Tax=Panicum virgatum TaxID=38727 RepID=UPI0019D612BE|nr:thiosulfate/3-mercaptopyruvate sulfurtransferase 2-like isoform X2 [Panicum virgatum]